MALHETHPGFELLKLEFHMLGPLVSVVVTSTGGTGVARVAGSAAQVDSMFDPKLLLGLGVVDHEVEVIFHYLCDLFLNV
jgi:hypothetical protein